MRKVTIIMTLVLMAALVIGVTANATGYTCGTYFPNWGMYNAAHQSINVGMIPWSKVTFINHAFFEVSSSYTLVSTDDYADYQASFAHSEGWDPGMIRGHMAEYKYYKTQYPNVKVLISIGGWTRGQNFHAMAASSSTRATFINSCVSFLKTYTFIDGLDFDWEYPGVNRAPDPNDSYDKGCPGGPEDTVNFTSLLSELRSAYNSNGLSGKLITLAGPGGYDKVDLQQPNIYKSYVDWINVMTYDIHGAWETNTNLQAALYANPNDPSGTSPVDIKNKYNIDYIMRYYRDTKGVPASKLNIGMPFYSRGWKNVTGGSNGLFGSASGAPVGNLDNASSPGGQNSYSQLLTLEGSMTKYRDSVNNEPYLFSGGIFYTYDDSISISNKCDYAKANNYGGVFSWEISTDTSSFTLQNLMWSKMNDGVVPTPTTSPTATATKTPTPTTTPTPTPGVPTPTPTPISGIVLSINGNILTWTDSANGADYHVYKNGGWLAWTSSRTYTVSGVSGDTFYVTNGGGSVRSNTVTYGGSNPTPTPSVTPTATKTPTPSVTPTATKTPTPTQSVVPTATKTPTPTPGVTPTATKTPTPTVTPTSSGASAWQPNTAYAVGALVTYGGHTYRCIQAHTSLVGWEPPNVPALWSLVS